MSRIDLSVPFSEKDEAKLLGARWDAKMKVWFVPDGVDSAAFRRWLPNAARALGIRANRYFIVQTTHRCWKCDELTRLYGFVLPSGHQTLEQNDDGPDVWCRHDQPGLVFYVTDLQPPIMARIKAITSHYYLDFSKTTSSSYWMNHCARCGMKQGDFAMYCEPGGAFCPMDERAASNVSMTAVSDVFGCNGSMSWGDQLDYILG